MKNRYFRKTKDVIVFLVSLWTIGKYKYINNNIDSNLVSLGDMILDYYSAYDYRQKYLVKYQVIIILIVMISF